MSPGQSSNSDLKELIDQRLREHGLLERTTEFQTSRREYMAGGVLGLGAVLSGSDVSPRSQSRETNLSREQSTSGSMQNHRQGTVVEPSDERGGGIQAAIDDADPGDTLLLKPNTTYVTTGTYSDGEAIDVDKRGLTIRGAGAGSRIRHDSSTTVAGEGNKMMKITADDVTLTHLTVDGDRQSAGEIDNQVDGHNIAVLGGADGFLMTTVRSVNSTGDGVEPFGTSTATATRGVIHGCLFENNWEQHVHLNGCKDYVIQSNILNKEINNGLISTYTSSGTATERCLVSNNVMRDGENVGLDLVSGGGTVRDIRIEGNHISKTTGAGVLLNEAEFSDSAPHRITITNNTIENTGKQGIALVPKTEMRDIVIQGNTIRDTAYSAIYFQAGDNRYRDIEITNNHILNPRTGDGSGPAVKMKTNGGEKHRVRFRGGSVLSRDTVQDDVPEYADLKRQESTQSTVDTAFLTDVYGDGVLRDCVIKDVSVSGYTESALSSLPDGLRVVGCEGDLTTADGGQATFSADGETKVFSLSHSLAGTIVDAGCPVSVQPMSEDAGAERISHVRLDHSAVRVVYESPPPTGTDNVVVGWSVGH